MTRGLSVGAWTFLGALVLYSPLLLGDHIRFTSDLAVHYRWAHQFIEAFAAGAWYPRWMPRAHGGLGEPAFVFYPPTFYWLVALAQKFTGDLWLAIKWVLVAMTWLGGVAAFWLLRTLGVRPGRAIAGALAIQAAPFLIHLVYSASALPWNISWPFGMAVLALTARQAMQPQTVSLALGVAVALLTSTHILSALMVLLCAPALVLATGPGWPQRLRAISGWALSVAFGLALAAAYLVPALLSQSTIQPELWYDERYINWRNSFLFPSVTAHLFGVHWNLLQWKMAALHVVALGLGAYWLYTRNSVRDRRWRTVAGFAAISAAALILGSELAYPLWAELGFFQKIQRPYRFLYVSTLSVSLMLILLWDSVPVAPKRAISRLAGLLLLAGAGLSALIVGQIVTSQATYRPAPALMAQQFGQGEYQTRHRKEGWKAYVESGGLMGECGREGIRCEALMTHSQHREWRIVADRPVVLRLPAFWFPAWGVLIDGAEQRTDPDPAAGLIQIPLKPGVHRVVLWWPGLAAERWGYTVSAIAATLLVLLAAANFRRRRRQSRRALAA